MFYGVIIRLYYFDNQQHHMPHIYVHYQEESAVIEIPNGKLLEGKIKSNKLKLVEAWIEIHKEELLADWELAINGEPVFKIDPLK